jgi:hypothetical protein
VRKGIDETGHGELLIIPSEKCYGAGTFETEDSRHFIRKLGTYAILPVSHFFGSLACEIPVGACTEALEDGWGSMVPQPG